MKRLDNGDIEVNGKVWESDESLPALYTRGDWYLSRWEEGWALVLDEATGIDSFSGSAETPEECIAQVKLAAELAGEL